MFFLLQTSRSEQWYETCLITLLNSNLRNCAAVGASTRRDWLRNICFRQRNS